MRLRRRHFLFWLFGGVLGQEGRCRPDVDTAKSIVRLLPDRESAAIVGEYYLDTRPQERDVGVLVSCIKGRRKNLRDLLHASIKTDFDRGQVVQVNGWVLSETEARLCALAALARSS